MPLYAGASSMLPYWMSPTIPNRKRGDFVPVVASSPGSFDDTRISKRINPSHDVYMATINLQQLKIECRNVMYFGDVNVYFVHEEVHALHQVDR